MSARTFLVSLLILVLSQPLEAAKTRAPARYQPDTDVEATALLEGTTWVAGGGNWKAWLKQVDSDERLNFIERTTGFAIDPFAGRPDQPPRYHCFLLVLENRGSGKLAFNPQSAWLRTNRNEIQLPRGLADVSFDYRVTGREMPVAYERIRDALFERGVSVGPGERIAGLLVFDRISDKSKRWNVSLRLIHSDGEQAAFTAPYRRTDLKPKKKKK